MPSTPIIFLLLLLQIILSTAFKIPVLTPPCPVKCNNTEVISPVHLHTALQNCPNCNGQPGHKVQYKPSKHIIIAMKICPRGYYGEGCRLTRTSAATTSVPPSPTSIFPSVNRSHPDLSNLSFENSRFSYNWISYAVISIILGIIVALVNFSCCRQLAAKFWRNTNPETAENVMYFENPVYSLPCASLAEAEL